MPPLNAMAIGAGACCLAPAGSISRIGGKCTGLIVSRCRIEGVSAFRQRNECLADGIRPCIRANASRADDFRLVGLRKDGRFFMDNEAEFDDEDDDGGDPPNVSKEQKSRKSETSAKKSPSKKTDRAVSKRSETRMMEHSSALGGSVREKTPRDIQSRGLVAKMSAQNTRSGDTGLDEASREEGVDPRLARRKEKKPPLEEQVRLPSLMKTNPHIAILGGGMSGLVCALTLEERGIRSTVFDTGKHGLGGRMATRHVVQHEGASMFFDHAAQYFTVKDPIFQKLVDQWISEGSVNEWKGIVGMLREGQFTELPHSVKYVGTHGMRALADHMVSKARLITVQRPCWISKMEAVDGSWYLTENGLGQGQFDAVVIAHNGKCANRLLAPSGAPLVAKQMKRLELSSIWALLAAFDEPLPQPSAITEGVVLDGAFVEGVNSLSWMGNNNGKLFNGEKNHPHCWTFFSTAAYGKKHKVPQENIPVVKAERVRREMLRGVEMALGIPEGALPTPLYTRVQLWGAALPTNTPGTPCIFDAHSRVGICGDWLLGASLEAAALSGIGLAHHIADYCEKAREGYFDKEKADLDEFSVGLHATLLSLDGHDIGQFPGNSTPQKQQITGRALAVR